jgi:hypothetical protein
MRHAHAPRFRIETVADYTCCLSHDALCVENWQLTRCLPQPQVETNRYADHADSRYT